ncbi:fimbrial protein [Salmonella enterica subsp. enterica serovar Wedding]
MRFSIKKAALAGVVCSVVACVSSAMAADGKSNSVSMRFVGSVTSSTCDVRPYNSSGVDATTINVGSMSPGSEGNATAAVSFSLKPTNCNVGGISSAAATVSWASSALSTIGFLNEHGTAKGVHVKLTPVNGAGANPIDETAGGVKADEVIREGANTVYYKATGDGKLNMPFAYKVSLERNGAETAEAGTVDADAIYTVSYN